MSWDRCPECGRMTEVSDQPCSVCSERHQDTTEIVDTICRHGEQGLREVKPDADRLDEYRGGPFKLTGRDLDLVREKLKK